MGNNVKQFGSILEKIKGLAKKIKELKDLTEEGKHIVEVIEKYESDKKKKVAPEEILLAKLLAEVLTYLADDLPPGINTYVKACLDAFKTALDVITGLTWGRFTKTLLTKVKKIEDADEEDALDAARGSAPESSGQQWLFDRWKLEVILKDKK